MHSRRLTRGELEKLKNAIDAKKSRKGKVSQPDAFALFMLDESLAVLNDSNRYKKYTSIYENLEQINGKYGLDMSLETARVAKSRALNELLKSFNGGDEIAGGSIYFGDDGFLYYKQPEVKYNDGFDGKLHVVLKDLLEHLQKSHAKKNSELAKSSAQIFYNNSGRLGAESQDLITEVLGYLLQMKSLTIVTNYENAQIAEWISDNSEKRGPAAVNNVKLIFGDIEGAFAHAHILIKQFVSHNEYKEIIFKCDPMTGIYIHEKKQQDREYAKKFYEHHEARINFLTKCVRRRYKVEERMTMRRIAMKNNLIAYDLTQQQSATDVMNDAMNLLRGMDSVFLKTEEEIEEDMSNIIRALNVARVCDGGNNTNMIRALALLQHESLFGNKDHIATQRSLNVMLQPENLELFERIIDRLSMSISFNYDLMEIKRAIDAMEPSDYHWAVVRLFTDTLPKSRMTLVDVLGDELLFSNDRYEMFESIARLITEKRLREKLVEHMETGKDIMDWVFERFEMESHKFMRDVGDMGEQGLDIASGR